jgi:hypothetical protein
MPIVGVWNLQAMAAGTTENQMKYVPIYLTRKIPINYQEMAPNR